MVTKLPIAAVLLALAAGCAPSAGGSPDLATATPFVTRSATPSPTPAPAGYVFPVQGTAKFGAAHHDCPATDVFAPCGSAFVAPTAGTVTAVSAKDGWSSKTDDGAERGGLSVTLAGADGVRYYGSHLRALDPAATPGRRVAAGTRLGVVGNTGSARGIACHLHFGLSPPCGSTDWWTRRGVVSPYPFLKSWQLGRQLSPAPAVAAWRTEKGCPSRSP